MSDVEDFRLTNGYVAAKRLADGRIAFVNRRMFNVQIGIGTEQYIEDAY